MITRDPWLVMSRYLQFGGKTTGLIPPNPVVTRFK